MAESVSIGTIDPRVALAIIETGAHGFHTENYRELRETVAARVAAMDILDGAGVQLQPTAENGDVEAA